MLLSVTIFLLDFMSLFHMIEFVREYRMNKDEERNEENRERAEVSKERVKRVEKGRRDRMTLALVLTNHMQRRWF